LDEFSVHKLCDELSALIEHKPGENPDSLTRARAAIESLHSTSLGDVLNKKLVSLAYGFEQWFSAGKWNRQNDGGRLVKHYLEDDLIGIRAAIWSKSQDDGQSKN
jgi:hypothetical protein